MAAKSSTTAKDTEIDKSFKTTIGYITKNDKNYIYIRANGSNYISINKYCIETKENTNIFRNYGKIDVYYVKDTYVQDNVLYTAFYETSSSEKIRVVGYNFDKEQIIFDNSFPVKLENRPYGTMCFGVDRKQNIYFARGIKGSDNRDRKVEISSYDKNGKLLDSFIKDPSYIIDYMEFTASSKDSTTMFLKLHTFQGYSSWWDDYAIRTNNGKFTKKDAYLIRQYGGMNLTFLDSSGKYAYDQYGEILEFNYNDSKQESNLSFVVKKAIKVDGSNIFLNGIYFSDDKYIYIGSTRGTIYVVNWKTFKTEKTLKLGNNIEIKGLHKSDNNIFIEYNNTEDSKNYIKTLNMSDFNVIKQNIKITTHTAITHTQDQIKKSYKDTSILNKSWDIYEQKPVTKAPYKEGTLKSQVKNDTLNQINYFRWLAGLNNVSIYEPYMKYAR